MPDSVDPDRFELISEVFESVRALHAAERDAALQAACGSDTALRAEVEALLEHHDAEDSRLDTAVWSRPVRRTDGDVPLPDIDGYRILRELGSGGMGVVFLAEQKRPRRHVAIKMLRSVLASEDVRRRFEREMEILARLAHPSIVPIHAADASGPQPYFTMEYVEGESLLDYCSANDSSLEERLGLFVAICDAVQYAHDAGVIHRDLKPANVLVDATGRPRILDFGVAKTTDFERQAVTLQTDLGLLLGTLPYMSPEQVAGRPDAIDGRSDVYALGVLGFELLSGRLPYDLDGKPIHEAMRVITESDATTLSSIDRTIRGDLETILAKALEKEPSRRYSRPGELANDVRRFLNNQPISARPVSVVYQIRKFARRNQTFVIALIAVFVALVLGTSFSLWFGFDANAARRDAEASERVTAERAYQANLAAADSGLRVADAGAARHRLDRIPLDQRQNWEYRYLRHLVDQSEECWTSEERAPYALAWSPNGDRVAIGYHDPQIRDLNGEITELELGASAKDSRTPHRPQVMAFSDDGRLIAAGCVDKMVRVWNAATGELLHEWADHDAAVTGLSFSGGGAMLDSTSLDRTVRRRHLEKDEDSGTLLYTLDGTATALAVSPTGEAFAVSFHERTAVLVDALTGTVRARCVGHDGPLTDVAFGPSGSRIATASVDGTVRVWDASDGTMLEVFEGEAAAVYAVCFTPDGRHLISGSQNGSIHIWDVEERRAAGVLLGHGDRIHDIRCRAEDGTIISASRDRTVRRWRSVAEGPRDVRVDHGGVVHMVATASDGSVLSGAVNRALHSWDPSSGAVRESIHVDALLTGLAASDLHGESWALAMPGVIEWRSRDLKEVHHRQLLSSDSLSVRLDARGSSWIALGSPGTTGVVQRADSDDTWSVTLPDQRVPAVAVADHGDWVALGQLNGAIQLAFRDGRRVRSLELRNRESVLSVAIDDRTESLACGDVTGTIHLWPRVGGVGGQRDPDECMVMSGQTTTVTSLAFHPMEPRLASGGSDGTIHLWDTRTGAELLRLRGHTNAVNALRFSPDGTMLISGASDGTARAWLAPVAD